MQRNKRGKMATMSHRDELEQLRVSAERLLGKEDYDGAANVYKRLVMLDPGDIVAWNGLGNCYFAQADYVGALGYFEKARKLDPHNATAWYNVGVTKLGMVDRAGAIAALKRSTELYPEDADAWFNLGFAFYEQKDLAGAIDACMCALRISPNDADILYTLACYFSLRGQFSEVIYHLTRAVALKPKLAQDARQEPDFDSIRDSPKFRAILESPALVTGAGAGQRAPKKRGRSSAPAATATTNRLPPQLGDMPDRNAGAGPLIVKTNGRALDQTAIEPVKPPPPQPEAPRDQSVIAAAKRPPHLEDRPLLSLLRQYEYIGGKVRVKVKVVNPGEEGLLRVILTLNIPTSFRLLRVEPLDYSHEGPVVRLHDLLPGEEKAVAYVLEPLICGKESIGGSVSGVNPKGRPFAIPMDPLEITIRCPLFARPEEANLPMVQRMLGDLPVKSDRVFYLPDTLAPSDALDITKSAISERDVRLVGTFTGTGEDGAFDESVWFYGVTKVGQKRYVLTAAVSAKDRAIRLSTACDDEAGCTGFLAEAGAAVRRELVRRGAVDSEEDVVELTCEKCGATLPCAPIVGRDVPCPECGWTWRVGDFFR